MSSPLEITHDQLRAIAGVSYSRGVTYAQRHQVIECRVEGDGLTGVVLGGELYRVRVESVGGQLRSACTCPSPHALCKHAVAMVVHHLERSRPRAAPHEHEPMFATRDELERWADEHEVRDVLATSADALIGELERAREHHYWLTTVLSRLSVRDIGSLAGAERHAAARGLARQLAAAAHRFVHRAAEAVEQGIAEERARPAAPPDRSLAAFWDRLVELRRVVRAHAAPRSRAARSTGSWSFDATEAVVTWKQPERLVRTRDFGRISVVARLDVPGGDAPRIACTCEARDARCSHALALIDDTLDLLGDPDRAEQARGVAGAMLQPGWARALQELDRLEARAAQPRAAIEVWWEIETELGSLTATPIVKKQTRRGAWTAGARVAPARLLDDHGDQLAEADRRVAEQLAAWTSASRASGTYPSRAFLALCGHPRIAIDGDLDRPFELRRVPLGFSALPSADHIRLEPSIEGARFSPKLLAALLPVFAPGEPLFTIDDERRRCLLIDVSDDARKVWQVLERHGESFPPESHPALLERLGRMEARLPLNVPASLKGTQLGAETTTVVRVRVVTSAREVSLELELFVRPGEGAPLFPPGVGPRDVLLARDGERGYVRRDLAAELPTARERLAQLPLDGAEEGPPNCFRIPAGDPALALIAALADPPPGLVAEWDDPPPTIAPAPALDALRVKVEVKRDWFGITGDLKVEAGRIELAVLLDAARRQQRFVRIDDQRWVELSQMMRDQLLAVSDRTFAARDRLELSPGAVPAIRALAEAGASVQAAPAWGELTERLAASRSLRPRPPATLAATLRDYQVDGHAWLTRIAAWGAGACLADDMGLGKTIQAIAVLLDRARLGPALVLAPTSVTYNWVAELERFAPSLRPVVYADQADRAGAIARLRKKDVLIASYGLLVRDADALAGRPFATLVIDEAQALKNPNTRRARAARRLDAGFRIALSGTPFENHLGELWSLFAIVFPGLLGSWDQFRGRFAVPIERSKDPAARAALSRVLQPFLLRRTKQEVARELPPRTEIHLPIALSEEELTMYEDARLAAIAELTSKPQGVPDEQRRFQVLAALTRLRLLASHPRLHDPASKVASSKMSRLLELLEELRREGHRALVFSQFTSHLALAREALDAAQIRTLYLDGATPAAERVRRIAQFQRGEADAFLISLKAGGTGINLTAADYVIHLDPWWNPAVEDQATDRAHRIGQTRPVTVYRLIARGTIEDQILHMHGDKRALVAGVLEGTDVAGRLSTRDLLALLQPG